MNRRTKRQKRTRRKLFLDARFSFARLESRQLLAGDLGTGLTSLAISYEELQRAPVEVVAEETCVEETSKTKSETSCNQSVGEERLIRGELALFMAPSGYSFDSFSQFYGGTNGSVTTDSNTTADDLDFNEVGETIPIPVTEPTPISSPAEELPIETPEKGTYYNSSLREKSAIEQTEQLELDSSSDESRIGMLGEQQTFALILPSAATSETFGILAKPTFGPHALQNSVAQSLEQIDTAFSSLDHRFKQRYLENLSLDEQRKDDQTAEDDFSLDFFSDHVREFGSTFESDNDSSRARIERVDFERKLDASFTFFDASNSKVEVETEVTDVKEEPPIRPAEPKDDSASDQSLSRKVQVVESAILLIGLPGSRLCRNGCETEDVA